MMNPNGDAEQARLEKLGERRKQLRDEQAKVTAEMRTLIRQLAADGVGVTALADTAGMTRRAVYDVLGHPRKNASARRSGPRQGK
jgi:hypothetical protein